ncbi:MAG: carboxymuconolactone decarboxylase family protein, partial [Actinobacteria bacterium]|nr:carboxymuconolactone decarboxylase family protein [Actinomycetota bacterium]
MERTTPTTATRSFRSRTPCRLSSPRSARCSTQTTAPPDPGLASSSAALQAWLGLNGALASTLTPELREQISIAVAEANGCAYCRLSAHTAVGGMVGLDEEELALAREGSSRDARREAALQFALAVLESRGNVSDNVLGRVRAAGFDDGEIAEVVAHVALNVLTNY